MPQAAGKKEDKLRLKFLLLHPPVLPIIFGIRHSNTNQAYFLLNIWFDPKALFGMTKN